jgi:molybdopterin biosynthesis enzyme
VGLLASVGVSSVLVVPKPKVGVMSTGDELTDTNTQTTTGTTHTHTHTQRGGKRHLESIMAEVPCAFFVCSVPVSDCCDLCALLSRRQGA